MILSRRIMIVLFLFSYLSCSYFGIGGTKVYVSKSKERKIGKLASLEVKKLWKEKELPKGFMNYVRTVLDKLEKKTGRLSYKVKVVESNKHFSVVLPGGYIFLTYGILKSLESEGELASIFALAFSHIKNEDARNFITRNYGTELVEKLSFKPPLTQTEENIVRQSMIAAFYDYGRKSLYRAEEDALDLLIRAGYNPLSLIRLVKKLDSPPLEPPTSLSFLKNDFPNKDERVERLNTIVGNFEASTLNLPFFEDIYDSLKTLYLK